MRFAAVLVVVLIGAPLHNGYSQASSCKPADSTNALIVAGVRTWMTAGDPLRAKLSIPLVSPSAVTLISADTMVCGRVRQSLDSLTLSLAPDATNLGPRPIHVVQLGTYYAAHNPGSRINGMLPVLIFDNLLRFVGLVPF